jgi:isocitrate dehydrogenase
VSGRGSAPTQRLVTEVSSFFERRVSAYQGAMMLEHLGHPEAAEAVVREMERVLADGPRTPDLGGKANTEEFGWAATEAV